MGFAMLRRWVEQGGATRFSVVTPRLESLHGLPVEHFPSIQAFAAAKPTPDSVVLAVRPQHLPALLPTLRPFAASLFISVAAAKTLAFYQSLLGEAVAVIRAMPNLAVKTGQGATLLVANAAVTPAQRGVAQRLFHPLGLVAWLTEEAQMEAATALSGCGPAYFYLLADVLAKAGTELGLAPALAQSLAKQTLLGSAALWQNDSTTATDCYQSIAVQGGMTEAALQVLQQNAALQQLMATALQAAVRRAGEMGG